MAIKTVDELVFELTEAKIAYADGFPIMQDDEFDALEALLRVRDPKNAYFNEIGAPVRGAKTELPVKMGSLDQVYGNDLYNRYPGELAVVMDKLDGCSLLLEYQDGKFTKAYTRGDGYEGQDVTAIINETSIPKTLVNEIESVYVRAEAIFREDDFARLNAEGALGKQYKNARNYVAGQLNRQEVKYKSFTDNLHIVTFEVNFSEETDENWQFTKADQLEYLGNKGFEVVNFDLIWFGDLNAEFLINEIATRKKKSPYALDGVVAEIDKWDLRKGTLWNGINPGYSWKFKMNNEGVVTHVVKVHWNISKHGYLKPRVEVDPIELGGVTISFATGFNAEFIEKNWIGPGSAIRVVRSGDVIPYIEAVLTHASEPDLPSEAEFGEMVWNESGVDLVLKDPDSSPAAVKKQIAEFFASISVDNLGPGSVDKLYESGHYTSIESIIKADEDDLVEILGVNGRKVMESLVKRLNPIDLADLAGSTNYFGRGLGKRKMKTLLEKVDILGDYDVTEMLNVEGFEMVTVDKVLNGIQPFKDFLARIDGYYTLKVMNSDGPLLGKAFCFTGVRDKDLENEIISLGGKIDSSVTKTTTHLICKDPSAGSAKLKKAEEKGVKLISIDNAREDIVGMSNA